MSLAPLILSLFPGIGMLDSAFEEEGFCVVRGPDVLWGGDIHRFRPPAGRFDGVIGGPPCQVHSRAAWLRRGKQYRARDLIPEFERCVAEAQPTWFLMECTTLAPPPRVPGYIARRMVLDNRWFGGQQRRRRAFTYGQRGADACQLLVDVATFDDPSVARTVLASDGKRDGKGCGLPDRRHTLSATKMTYVQACELQGLAPDFLAQAPFTKEGRWRVVGNGVPMAMGRGLAKAVRRAMEAAGVPAT